SSTLHLPHCTFAHQHSPHRSSNNEASGTVSMSLVDRARALCAVADDVQRATIEASRRIAALHGSPDRAPKKRKPTARVKEPPDVCARPPLDVPPPRGKGWRRLGPVSVVRGSNRVSAPPQTSRRALTREVEVCVGGGFYRIVPADIDPGGGFCISLDRDYAGDTNMACMLYLRKQREDRKNREPVTRAEIPAAEQARRVMTSSRGEAEKVVSSKVSKLKKHIIPSSPPNNARPTPAPFGSVGETPTLSDLASTKGTSPSPFSTGIEEKLDVFVMSRPGGRKGSNTATVRDAQRRARRRAQKTRRTAEKEQRADPTEPTTKSPTAADIERLKASRRAALARVASAKQKETEKREANEKAEEERRKREPAATKRADALRSVAAARAGAVAAEKRQQERKMALVRQVEEEAKRERVAAVLAYNEAEADEREKQVRNETHVRIRREERRRELALRRQEDERAEMMRLHEVGGKYQSAAAVAASIYASTPPPVQSARSFFSISGSASASETGGGGGLASTSAPTRIEPLRSGARKTWGRADSFHTDFVRGNLNSAGNAHASRETGRDVVKTNRHQPAGDVLSTADTATILPSSASPDTRTTPRRDKDGNPTMSAVGGNGQGLSSPTQASSPAVGTNSNVPAGTNATWARSVRVRSRSGGGGGGRKDLALDRRRISTTPVWKRPAVPLSKPYVPVPRKDGGRV
ncbi:unnamed protein product, partial [Hapterophycus canaliculatus]